MAPGGAEGEGRVKGVAGPGLAAFLLLAACNGGVTAPVGRSPLPEEGGPAPTATALERQTHDLVNQRRTARALPILRWDDRVAAIAREHSEAMATGRRGFGHDGFEGRAERVAGMFPVRSMDENVAFDSRTVPCLARLVVEGWIASAGHRQNIEGDFTLTGIGAAAGRDGTRYFTQIFVKTE